MDTARSFFVRVSSLTVKVVMSVVLVLGAISAISAAYASENTERFVQDLIDESFRILNQDTLSDLQRGEQLRELLGSVSDLNRTAVFTLGPYINGSDQSEVDTFVHIFKEHITRTIETHLQEYAGYALSVTGSTDRSVDDSVVTISISLLNNTNIQGAFRVRKNEDDTLVITDVQMEGVWMAIHDRADFTSYLQRNSGNISALSKLLNEQTQNPQAAKDETS